MSVLCIPLFLFLPWTTLMDELGVGFIIHHQNYLQSRNVILETCWRPNVSPWSLPWVTLTPLILVTCKIYMNVIAESILLTWCPYIIIDNGARQRWGARFPWKIKDVWDWHVEAHVWCTIEGKGTLGKGEQVWLVHSLQRGLKAHKEAKTHTCKWSLILNNDKKNE